MELRTQNEQLRRVDRRIDLLVEDIRTELLARDNTSAELNDRTVRSLLKYIANPLKNLSIDGNEMMLDDMLDLYDKVIAELDGIVGNKKYSDEKKLSSSELKTFEKARDILKKDKEKGIDVIDEVFTEVLKDQRSGKLEKTYIRREVTKNKEIDEINKKIYKVGNEISSALRPSLDLIDKLSPELDLFADNEVTYIKLEKIDEKLDKVFMKLAEPNLSEEEKETIEIAQKSLLERKISTIRESNSELKKEEYNQEENENLLTYAERLHRAFSTQAITNEDVLMQKVSNELEKKINIAEFDKNTERYTIKEVKIKERYFADMQNGTLSVEDLKKFAKNMQNDLEQLQTAVDAKIDEKSELEEQKAELEEEIVNEIKTSTLSVVPYVEKDKGELSGFEKWRQRLVFRFKNPEVFFGNKKEVEDAMCKAKIAKATMPIDRTALLKDVENKQKTFKEKYAVKTKVKSNIYKAWDKNRVPNSRDNNEGR